MPDIESLIKGMKLTLIKRLLNNRSNLNVLSHAVTDISDFKTFCPNQLDPLNIQQDVSMFYKQLLEYWFVFYGTEPKDVNEIFNESMWKN